MKTGLLWFDSNPDRSLEEKVRVAAERYAVKFGVSPNACFVNPELLGREEVHIGGVQVSAAPNILPHHFLLGVSKL